MLFWNFTIWWVHMSTLCATVVFGRLPQDLSSTMNPKTKTELAAFQQRFERFLSDSEQLLKEICQSRPSLGRLPSSFAAVKPLP
jgi:hypothetical protein